jgi:hypothetical protein
MGADILRAHQAVSGVHGLKIIDPNGRWCLLSADATPGGEDALGYPGYGVGCLMLSTIGLAAFP